MIKSARVLFLTVSLSTFRLVAQVAAPSPLVAPEAALAVVPGAWMLAESRADRALQMGFAATAASGYREILREPALPADARHRLTLGLVSALMDAGELEEAEKALETYDGPRNSAYQLRVGLLAADDRRFGAAKAALGASNAEELPAVDKGWWYHLQALVADSENNVEQRNAAYAQALSAAVSEWQRSRFLLGQEQAALRVAAPSEAQIATAKSNMERFQGTRQGYTWAKAYAAVLNAAGRGNEAQTLLQRQLMAVPPTERNTIDQLRLVLGMIAGERSNTGRNSFREILRNGQRPETQRLALQLLARGAVSEADRVQLRRDLGDLINGTSQHAIIEDLYLVRAQLALMDKLYADAEVSARQLLEFFPATVLKPEALGVRLSVAWEQKRYRAAADLSAQLRANLPPGRERAELGVLLAEAFFRAPDYKSAADAYEAALREAPAVVPAGRLIFQRVLSDIRAGTPQQLESAARQLDEAANNPALDSLNRWQAEWNLVREMQARGQSAAASARVEKVLASGNQGVPEELRVRLLWLRAKLSFDNEQYEAVLQQSDEVLGSLEKITTLDATLRANVVSNTQLLKAQALFELKRDAEAAGILTDLRKDHRSTAAAPESYLVEATYLTRREDLVGAQRVLQAFVDAEKGNKNPYVPMALYRAALILERQGLDRHLQDAYKKLEDLVIEYPNDVMVFYARLKQGDLLRKLNDFPAARQIYENLVNTESRHPDVLLAQIALADCLFAQGANSVVNYESAATIYERLRDLPSAPVDLRVEAGFKWGYALAKRSQSSQGQLAKDQSAKAQTVFWSVVTTFLLDANLAKDLSARGRDWVARTLFELGQLHETAGRFDEAQRIYQLVIDSKLKGAALAESKLARFRPAPEAKP